MNKEFERIKNCDFIVASILMQGGTLKDCIVQLIKSRKRLMDRNDYLERLVPRKRRMRDGSIAVWHCPDELIPLETME